MEKLFSGFASVSAYQRHGVRELHENTRRYDFYYRCYNTQRLQQSKKLLQWSLQKTQEAFRLSRSELKLIIEIFTGHGPVNYHLYKIGKANSPLCRKYENSGRSNGIREFRSCCLTSEEMGRAQL